MQSEIDSLREVNLKLLAEITELRKENAEVKAENIEVKSENAKLKHSLEEHEARFTNLEQKDKEKTNLIAKSDDDIKEIKQEQIAINHPVQDDDTSLPKSPINSESQVIPQSSVSSPIEDNFNAENSSNVTQPICSESKSLEEKEDNEFIVSVYKEKVSNEIRQRRREKKLVHSCRDQELLLDSTVASPNIPHEQENIQSHFQTSNESGEREPEGMSISNASGVSETQDDSSKIGPVDSPKSQVSIPSTSSSDQISESNQSRLPISILPEDPEEKQKHIIGLVLERFPYLSLEYSESYGDRFVFNSLAPCPMCNKDHEGENLKGGWGDDIVHSKTSSAIIRHWLMRSSVVTASAVVIFSGSINNPGQEQYFCVAIVMNFPQCSGMFYLTHYAVLNY
ncbi:unnamed protein product [Rhizophagus irregularis]|nr:unnamed protein product [Rhizophagus irregularis]